jgi:N6-adenosine-specific RNA methylase IME4
MLQICQKLRISITLDFYLLHHNLVVRNTGSDHNISRREDMKKYQIIYADPPWLYKCGTNHLSKVSMINGKNTHHYPAMKLDDIKKMNIGKIADDNCLLFLWVTNPFLKFGIDVMYAWGFNYSTVGFIWHKQKALLGTYTLSECEICLIGKKGKVPKPRGKRNVRQFLSMKSNKHSKKPDEVRFRIGEMFPMQNKIELFARQRVEGWDAWGDEINPDAPAENQGAEPVHLTTAAVCNTAGH